MGVPGFYSWLTKRYPLIKHLIDKDQVPTIDYLYLDMNGIIYKCVKDESIIFKSKIVPKQMEEIWLDVFNYINMLVDILKPNKMIVLGLDGVAPRAKMNNQRSRRFKSSRDHKKSMEQFYGYVGQTQSTENFKNNSISPGTQFMEELGNNLQFFIKKKIQQDDYWKSLSVIFTSSGSPGQGQHKIMEFIRSNKQNFLPDDCHCLYGADADLIMLSMTLPLKNLCIIRQQFVFTDDKVKISQSKKQKLVNFQMIFVTIMRQYFEIQYSRLKDQMKVQFDLNRIIKDFVFLFFFIGNDFLPRCMAYNIRQSSIEDLILAFKEFLIVTNDYVVGPEKLNLKALTLLANAVATRESKFIDQKAQDFQRQSKLQQKEKQQFKKQFNELVKTKNMQEQQFISQLKVLYMNDQVQARKWYYGRYFGLDPTAQPEQFYQLLSQFLYGLQFVYEYYFINLPSWQWYYPYYCAPLVSDLFYYLNYLSQNNQQIPKLNPGAPAQPFKQLMCILPKQSCQLLPKQFCQYLSDKKSPLRSPIDYYPDQFDQQPYGSLREHQHIALIPFLDIDLINKVYDEAIVKIKDQKVLARNQNRLSTLYEYDSKAKEIFIQSKFKSIPCVTCTIEQTPVNLRQKLKWGKNNPKYIQLQQNKKLHKMPSLSIKRYRAQEQADKKRRYFVLELIPQTQNGQKAKYKIGEQIFYGYPLQKSGKVQAILNQKSFISANNFYAEDYKIEKAADFRENKFLKQNPKGAFVAIKSYLTKENRLQYKWDEVEQFIFTQQTQQFVRCLNGDFQRIYNGAEKPRYQIVPHLYASKHKVYENTKDNIKFKNMQEQFGIGEDVLIFPHNKPEQKQPLQKSVFKGKVTGYTDRRVKVQLGQRLRQLDKNKLNNIVHTRQIYFTLRFCAFILQIKQDVLLTLLQSVNIEVQHPQLPPSIDIGLNFINRSEQKLVPNLVRINFDGVDDVANVQRLYSQLDISLKGLQLIIEYKQKFGDVFQFIEKRNQRLIDERDQKNRINWRQKIALKQLFDNYSEDQNQKAVKKLMNVYLWLIKKQQTHMPLSSVYSKQISVRNIRKLQQQFTQMNRKQKQKKRKYQDPKIIEVDPNYLFSRRLAAFGKLYLNKPPLPHTIRDQVICLQPEFFGEVGVVIGYDYNKYEVMFVKPSFGKSDLNGICEDLWAGKFMQRDLYNYDIWPEYLRPRYKTTNRAEIIGWDGAKEGMYILPKFKQKALKQFADIQKLAEKNIFSPQFLDFIANAKKNQRVQKIDEDFQVVDNRKGQYAYKYDKGKTTIQKQYVQKVAKDKKYMQKPVEQSFKAQPEQIEKQIIQNKASQQNHPKSQEQEVKKQKENKNIKYKEKQRADKDVEETKVGDEGQEDGDDMLK